MGESWSDLTAVEYLAEHGLVPSDDEDPFAVGAVFDAWLALPGDASMLDARDALLAADVVRFGGENQAGIWHAHAARGFGQRAITTDTDDPQPEANFESPEEVEGARRFEVVDRAGGAPVPATVMVGDYEANVTPIADTIGSTPKSDRASFVPGTRHEPPARAARRGQRAAATRGRGRRERLRQPEPPLYTSPADAFPGGRPRPLAPDMTLRDLDVPDTTATHVRLRVLTRPVHRLSTAARVQVVVLRSGKVVKRSAPEAVRAPGRTGSCSRGAHGPRRLPRPADGDASRQTRRPGHVDRPQALRR